MVILDTVSVFDKERKGERLRMCFLANFADIRKAIFSSLRKSASALQQFIFCIPMMMMQAACKTKVRSQIIFLLQCKVIVGIVPAIIGPSLAIKITRQRKSVEQNLQWVIVK